MKLRFGRIIIAAFSAELLAIFTLVVFVFLFNPTSAESAQDFALRIGLLAGPVAGFFFTFLAAWWVAYPLKEQELLHGIVTGVAVALLDIAMLIASNAEFTPVFIVSNIGRVIAGTAGGWLATRSTRAPTTS